MRKTFTFPGRISSALFAVLLCVSGNFFAQTFSSADVMTVPASQNNQPASIYPSSITVAGGPATITGMSVTLNSVTHTWPDDFEVVLVAPNGNNLVLMSDCGGSTDISGVSITFSDVAPAALNTAGGIVSGTYLPTDHFDGTDPAMPAPFSGTLASPAPTGSATLGSQFVGSNANGTWSLYVRDEFNFDGGNISGWSITFEQAVVGCTDPDACNFDPLAAANDGSCVFPGCTDDTACNFNPEAGCDDGSCCFGECVTLVITGGSFPEEIGWQFLAPNGDIIDSGDFGGVAVGGILHAAFYCLDAPACDYSLVLTDDFGDGWNGAQYFFLDSAGDIFLQGTFVQTNDVPASETVTFPIGLTLGCTDPLASNFDPTAGCNDGSCVACAPGEQTVSILMGDFGDDGWQGGAYSIANSNGDVLFTGSLDGAALGDGVSFGQDIICLADGCYTITIAGSNAPEDIAFQVLDASNNLIIQGFSPIVGDGVAYGFALGEDQGCTFEGCTNADCFNYNPFATTDDGSCICPPANDDCVNATLLECGTSQDGSLRFADVEAGLPACDLSVSTGGVWYTFVGTGNDVTVATCGTTWDSKLHIYSGTCGSLVCEASDDDACDAPTGTASSVTFASEEGVTYYALVTRFSSSTVGEDFVISLDCPTNTIWDIVQNSTVHNTLEAAVNAAGLGDALSGPGPLTLFAPTDDAFAALPAGTVDGLLADPTGALTDVLLYHVVEGSNLAASLSDGQTITTLLGENITVTITVDGVFINDAQVTVADVLADNGVVHVIDAVLIPPAAPATTVFDVIAGSEVHNTLEAAITAAGLIETLEGDGPFTVFAPTDAAFAALPEGTVDALLADPTGQLTDILLYHVVAGLALAADLSDGQVITTVLGEDVTVTITPEGVFINDAEVIVTDLLADNGVVHVIDAVLLPPAPITVMDIIATSEVHNTLEAAITAAGLVETLQSAGPFTVFAPTDDAFAALPEGTVEALLADPTGQLTDILLYHVVAGQTLSGDLSDGQVITTVLGEDITVTITVDGVFINDAQVIVVDILADNGVVHVIDGVLLPPPPITVMDIIANSEVHNTLEAAITAAGLVETLQSAGPFTVFAPTDDAFAALPEGTVEALLADPTGQLTDILLYHVVAGQALSGDLSDGQVITTVLGEDITVTITDDGVFINDAQVIVVDILADNGVVHVIDGVLLPPVPITVMDIIANSEVHNTLETAIGLAGLTETLQGAGPFTVFAPTDDAFAALPSSVLNALLADPTGGLTNVLLYHVVAGQNLSSELSDGQSITTVLGQDVVVTINDDGVFINGAQVVLADLEADNGVVHVIDAVLVPVAVEVVVEASTTEVCEGNTISFISETASTLAEIVSEEWIVTGPEAFDAVGGIVEFTFETPGVYEVTFTATDALGFSASSSVTVTITEAPVYFADSDGDGFGDVNNTLSSCSPVDGFVSVAGDCDDQNADVFPGAEEVCDGVDNDCDDNIDEGVQTTFYADNDGDGFGDASNSVTACSAPEGFVTNDGDCNDDNASIRPGAIEACDGVDNDCDDDTDEGCFGPAPDNDEIGGATPINATAYNVTQPLYGNLFNATPSDEYVDDDAFEGAGQDAWFQFQSTSEAVRIRVYSAVCNVAIQLQDSEGNVVAEEDANANAGTEILNVDGLTPNATYFVAVRNLVNVGGPYVINVRRYDPSFLTTTTAQTLCGNARCQFTNANAYTFEFEGQTSGITYTRTINSSTIALLSGVVGLEAGQTYNTTVNATFLPTNSVGSVETMNVEGVTTLPFVVSPSAAMSLRAIDVCPSVKTLASNILATPFNCGAVDFQWEFTRTAPSASLPVVFLKGNSSRFLQLATVPGIESGATYNVRVRPRFANGSFGQWGPVNCVSTVGSVTMDAVNNEVLAPETETGIEEAGIATAMVIFPNPISGNEVQLMSDVQLSDCNVTITDLTGRRVAQWNGYELNTGVSTFRPAGTLTSGVYMLRVESAQGTASYRFIVQ